MVIHPPMLYSGYTLLAIPFAFGIGALISGRLSTEWIAVSRRFALAAWLFLGTGIVLGALWSYTELGWGGYWAWDPVENAALMPWLATTAFIHSIMIQEKRGMLKVWNVSLVLTSGTLAILGTFLVRSGILDSIHAFGASTLGVPFVLLLATMIISGITLVLRRREQLRSEARLESLLSREAVFLLQNLVLMAMVFVIFWITFFPLISEAVTGTKVSVGPPAFRPFIVPLALVLVALSGVGPLIAWRRVTAGNLRRNFALPVTGALATCLGLVITGWGLGHAFALIMFTCGSFVLFAVAQEVWRGTGARRAMTREAPPVAVVQLVRRNRRRYGGYLAHAGLAVLLIGVAASSSFQHSRDTVLRPGQSTQVGGYHVTYVRPTAVVMPQRVTFGALLDVSKGAKHVATLQTGRGFYPSQDPTLGPIGRFFNGEADSDVGLQLGATRDIWTVVNPDLTPLGGLISQGNKVFAAPITDYIKRTGQLPPNNSPIWALRNQAIREIANRYVTRPWPVSFRLIVEPLVIWIWIGAIIVVLGGLLALWPVPRLARRRRMVTLPVPGAAAPAPTSSPPATVTAARELV
jgi:cytochrome c-type biogenesis protein CcmF